MLAEEKVIKEPKKEIKQIISLLKELKSTDLPVLIEHIKETFQLKEQPISESGPKKSENVKEKENDSNVDLKIDGMTEETNTTLKLQAYKIISELSKEFENELNVIQARKLVEEKGILANNVTISRAKEIQAQLAEKNVRISFVATK